MFLSWLCINWTLRNWNLLNLAYPFWPNGINWTLRNWNMYSLTYSLDVGVLIGPCGIETQEMLRIPGWRMGINWTLRNWNAVGLADTVIVYCINWTLRNWNTVGTILLPHLIKVLIGPCGIETSLGGCYFAGRKQY